MIPHNFLNFGNVNPYLVNPPLYNPYLPPTLPSPFYPYHLAPIYHPFNPMPLENNLVVPPPPIPVAQSRPAVEKVVEDVDRKDEEWEGYSSKNQNFERNIMSNIAHHLMSYLRRTSKLKPILEKIILKHKLNITAADFFDFISKIQIKNYIRVKLLKQEWLDQNNDKNLATAFRVLVYYFLSQKYCLWIQGSRKIKGFNRFCHIQKRREFIRVVRNKD